MIINPFRLQRYIKTPELPSNSGVFCDNIVFQGGEVEENQAWQEAKDVETPICTFKRH